MPNVQLQITVNPGADVIINVQRTLNDNSVYAIQETVADGTTDREYAITFDKDRLSLFSVASSAAIHIKTNSSGSPVNEFDIEAGVPMLYTGEEGETNPFSADVTKLFISNASGGPAVVKIIILHDVTPAA